MECRAVPYFDRSVETEARSDRVGLGFSELAFSQAANLMPTIS